MHLLIAIQFVELNELLELTISSHSEQFYLLGLYLVQGQASDEADVDTEGAMAASAMYAEEDTVVNRDPVGFGGMTVTTELIHVCLHGLDFFFETLLLLILRIAEVIDFKIMALRSHQPILCQLRIIKYPFVKHFTLAAFLVVISCT